MRIRPAGAELFYADGRTDTTDMMNLTADFSNPAKEPKSYKNTYIHTYIHTYIRTYIRTYMRQYFIYNVIMDGNVIQSLKYPLQKSTKNQPQDVNDIFRFLTDSK